MTFLRGTQVAYIPNHAKGNVYHPDVEFGFITSVKGDNAFVRYWYRGRYPRVSLEIDECIRTKTNSERTPLDSLIVFHTVPQVVVDVALDLIYSETAF